MPEAYAQKNAPQAKGDCIGLIAGSGRFPIIFAENVKRLGYTVSAVAHIGETAPELAQYVDRIHWIKIGQFNKLIEALKEDGVRQAVMLGESARRTSSRRSGRTSGRWRCSAA